MKPTRDLFLAPTPQSLASRPSGETVLLALSGGADSTALLHVLSRQAQKYGFSVVTAHVHHGIRGDEADRDADFCASLAERYGWEHLTHAADVPSLARAHGRSLEHEAREVRYAFFRRVMEERGIEILATAHHADDNLETVLFRMARGTGLHGLCGIPPTRAFGSGVLVRPLLGYSRRDILNFCKREGLAFVTDSTNEAPDCSRNRLRLEVVPRLEREFGDLQERVYRMTQSISLDQDYLTGEAEKFLNASLVDGGVSAEALRGVHPAIRRRALSMLLPGTLEAVHLEAVDALLKKGASGASVSLPADTSACLQGDTLRIVPDLRLSEAFAPFDFAIGSRSLCDGGLTVCVKRHEKTERTENRHREYTSVCIIKKEAIDGAGEKLYFRPRRAGDTLLRNGVRREVRRLYREAGVPVAIRDSLPLLCMGDRILWAPFVGCSDGFGEKVAERENLILTVSVSACRSAEQKGR